MTFYYFIIRKIIEKFYITFILMIMIASSIVIACTSMGILEKQLYMYNVFNSEGLKDSISVSLRKGTGDELHEILKEAQRNNKIKNFLGIDIASYSNYEVNNETLYSYDLALLTKIKLPLAEGTWFSDNNDNETIPCVASYGYYGIYEVGEKYNIEVRENKRITIEIIGILYPNIEILSQENAWLHTITNSFKEDMYALIISKESANEMGIRESFISGNNFFVFPQISDMNGTELNKEVSDYAQILKTSNIVDSYKNGVWPSVFHEIINTILIALIATLGIVGYFYLITNLEEKDYKIYMALGMTWSKCVKYILLRGIILVYVPIIVGYLIFLNYIDSKNLYSIITHKLSHFIVIFALYSFAYIFTVISIYYRMKKMKLNEMIVEGRK